MTRASLAPALGAAAALALLGSTASTAPGVAAQQHVAAPTAPGTVNPAPNRRADEGQGPFGTLVIRGAILIDGTGAPPMGPVDIVVEHNRIRSVRSAGTPGLALEPGRPPANADHEIDATGMYVLPGLIDLHAHAGEAPKNPDAEYTYKLWLAHGVTTVRGVSLGPHAFSASEKARSARNEIVAPRIFNYQTPGSGWDQGAVETPAQARAWVRWAAQNGIDGVKMFGPRPDIAEAILDEARTLEFGSTAHLSQFGVANLNAIQAARLGLRTVTHFYGHFEALMRDHVVQPWPPEMNYNDEQWRFSQVAQLWDKIHEPGGPEWRAYLAEHVELGTTFDPTMTAYAASRDVMRMRSAEWHDAYTLPSLMAFYEPSLTNHGSYYHYWTSWHEVAWRNFYQVWFKLLNDYKRMGGRVTASADAGYIYNTYGFGNIHELELLQEAGFHPLEVVQAATMNPALTLHEPLGTPIEFGVVRAGLLADMLIVDQNPIENLKVLYGIGAVKLDTAAGRTERVGGVKYTIKDGIVYDARALLADVGAMVAAQKQARGRPTAGR